MDVQCIHDEKRSDNLRFQIYQGQTSITAGLLNGVRHIRLTIQMPLADYDALPPDRIGHLRQSLMTAYSSLEGGQ